MEELKKELDNVSGGDGLVQADFSQIAQGLSKQIESISNTYKSLKDSGKLTPEREKKFQQIFKNLSAAAEKYSDVSLAILEKNDNFKI